jgi:hypothetical protein
MGLFSSPVLIRIKTESGEIISERLIPGGETFTITLPDQFAEDYYVARSR